MRVTAGWLLLVSIGLLVADTFLAARTPNACCCAAMAGMAKNASCPLKQQSQRSCDLHGRGHCSLDRTDTSTDAQNRRAPDSRDPSTLTEVESTKPAVSRVFLFASETDAHPHSQNPLPETPPPRCN
jgi:hypothetical protein